MSSKLNTKYCYACSSWYCDSPIDYGAGIHPDIPFNIAEYITKFDGDGWDMPTQSPITNSTSAEEILKLMNGILVERGKFYGDGDEQERNMDKCVSAFNALSGHKLTVTDGWIFMNLLKLSRHYTGPFKFDNLMDGSNYMVLATEEAANEYLKQGNIIEELK